MNNLVDRAIYGNIMAGVVIILLPKFVNYIGGELMVQKLESMPFFVDPFLLSGSLVVFSALNILGYRRMERRNSPTVTDQIDVSD